MVENKSWCSLPWNSLFVTNDGKYRICQRAQLGKSKGLMIKNNEYASTKNTSIEQSRNSEELKELRLAMLRGERHETCKRCNEEDDLGIRSERMSHRGYWPDLNLEKIENLTKKDGSIDTDDFSIRYVDMRTGNKCILQCRSCSPSSSSGLYLEHNLLGNTGFTINGKKYNYKGEGSSISIDNSDDLNWYENDQFWNQFDKHLPNIRNIHVVGGEPLIIDQFVKLMERIVNSGYASNIKIECNSALFTIPKNVLNLWTHFDTVSVGVSIDGVGDINDYIRYPSKWNNIVRNINKLDKTKGNFLNWFAITIMAYNIYYLPELLEWIRSNRFKTFVDKDTSHPLWHPEYLSTKVFPLHIKNLIRDKLQKVSHEGARKVVDKYIDFMYSEDLSHLLSKFYSITKAKDEIRNVSFEETMPEIAKPIKEHLKKNGHPNL